MAIAGIAVTITTSMSRANNLCPKLANRCSVDNVFIACRSGVVFVIFQYPKSVSGATSKWLVV